ncbi:MAG: hypothetical protein GY754_11780 [bacterium]|nr:hypothetical protein [bacterium]
MNLKLKNIYPYGDDKTMLFVSIEAKYGWKGETCNDVIKINYNGKKREAFLTVKIENPGVGLLAERIIEVITTIDFKQDVTRNPVVIVIERLSDSLGMEYKREMLEDALLAFKGVKLE